RGYFSFICREKPVAKYLKCTPVLLLYTACLPMGSLLLLPLIPSATLTLRTRVRDYKDTQAHACPNKNTTHASAPKRTNRARRRWGRSRCFCFRRIRWKEKTHRTDNIPTIGCCDSTTHTYW
ncbi:unnamed protein product, partial [Ectocarpus sp. 13 AM-2016]